MQHISTSEENSDPSDADPTDILSGFLPEPEYARARGVSVRTCQRDRRLRQAPPHVFFGRQVFYRIDAVREWLLKNERTVDLSVDARRSGSVRRFPRR